ncbi:MAG: SURF1 family protein [Chromatiales bacterium]|nr:SURF1 family protein [Chromatiales bacterium]
MILPILLYLGFWQLGRADEKSRIMAQFAANAEGDALRLNAEVASHEDFRYQVVQSHGSFLGGRQLLLDNQIEAGQPGFHVFTPFQTDEGDMILVNRGWVPMDMHRDPVGDLRVDEKPRILRGVLNHPPDVGYRLDAVDASDWPRLVQYIDTEELSATLGQKLLPSIVWLDPQTPDGFVRQWKVVPFGPEKHLGYAVQWFGLAAALVGIYLIVNVKRSKPQ